MRIDNWPIDRIMQLPDHVFGRKWLVGTTVFTFADNVEYYLIEEKLPTRFVLWDVVISCCRGSVGTDIAVTLRLCREIPTLGTLAGMRRLLNQVGIATYDYEMSAGRGRVTHVGPMRIIIEAGGDMVGGAIIFFSEEITCAHYISLLISSVPTEVPDWLVSA